MTKSKIKILMASAIFVVALNIALYTWNQSPKILKVPYLENVQVDRVAFDKEGQVWVSGGGELRVYKDGNLFQAFTNEDTPVLGEYLRELEIDNKGRVWITSQLSEYEAHLAFFDGTKWSTVGVFSNPLGEKPGIKPLAIDTQGRAWVGTASGLYIFDGENQENYTSHNSGLLGNIVTCISFDNQGRAWIGSWGKTTRVGLNIFDGKD